MKDTPKTVGSAINPKIAAGFAMTAVANAAYVAVLVEALVKTLVENGTLSGDDARDFIARALSAAQSAPVDTPLGPKLREHLEAGVFDFAQSLKV